MRVRIQRGAEEVGGNCVEVATDAGSWIVLDAGFPLSGDATAGPVPPVGGFRMPVESPPLAVVVSHPHLDHYGLVPEIARSVPVYMGREAGALLSAAAFFSARSASARPCSDPRLSEATGRNSVVRLCLVGVMA